MKTHSIVAMFIVLGLFAETSFAAGYARLGAMYQSTKAGNEGEDTPSSSRTLLDVGGGYVSTQGWTIGALYSSEKYSAASTFDRTAFGPTVGWASPKDGPYILATYFLSVSRADEYKGSGYQLDFGYKLPVGSIFLAPQLSYRSLAYDKVGSNTLNPKYNEVKIDPYFVAWIDF